MGERHRGLGGERRRRDEWRRWAGELEAILVEARSPDEKDRE